MQRQAWGKSDKTGDAPHLAHHLAHHCADVAACFECLCALPVIRRRLETAAGQALSDVQISRLAVLVFLHDIGKLHPRFQALNWPAPDNHGARRGHTAQGYALFHPNHFNGPAELPQCLHQQALFDWGVMPPLLAAVMAHHGLPFNTAQAKLDQHGRWPTEPLRQYDHVGEARAIGELMPAWFEAAFTADAAPLPATAPRFDHLVCGLVTLADWIGSDRRHFSYEPALRHDYMATARQCAAGAVTSLQIDVGRQRAAMPADIAESAGFARLSAQPSPRPHQTAINQVDRDAQLVILEAETGSGKTEAALWRYARLFGEGLVDGMYFAVPTRSAAMQLHERIKDAMGRVFADQRPAVILGVPGYFRVDQHEGQALPHWQVLWDDSATASDDELAARWACEHSKRYLAAQICVGTIDQAMLAGLQVKHAHMRLAALSRSLLVIDEVHASDAYMTAIQTALVNTHMSAGGYALLMSATLGSTARAQWLRHHPVSFEDAVTTPYPAIWTDRDAAPATLPEPVSGPDKQVHIEVCKTTEVDAMARCALAAARQGARVMIIRNTVKDATLVQRAIEAATQPDDDNLLFKVGGVLTLHHGRFAKADRGLLDTAVETYLSTQTDRPQMGCIVVGTQTLEQSLDIDCDLLFTDLCPMDVLLQRLGRLHRKLLVRPAGFDVPHAVVWSGQDDVTSALASVTAPRRTRPAPHGLGLVYRNLAILELTRRLVEAEPKWDIPAMNRYLVERSMHDDCVAAVIEELAISDPESASAWRQHYMQEWGQNAASATHARSLTVACDTPFDQAQFASEEQKIRTRLGQDGIDIKLPAPMPGPFGELVDNFVLPGYWHVAPPEGDVTVRALGDGVLELGVGDQRLIYDRVGLQQGPKPT